MRKSSFLLLIIVAVLFAAVPKQISYQGILTDALGQPKVDGAYEMTFKLYNVSSEGFNIWSETKTVNVKGGVFNTTLGSDSALTLPFDTTYWLGVSVAGGAEFTPRVQLTASGYAIRSILADTSSFAHAAQVSVYADSSAKAYSSDIATTATNASYADSSAKAGVADSSVKATNANQATVAATVTSVPMAAIAANAIDSTKLGVGSVGSSEIADGSISTIDVSATFIAPYADSADTAGYALVAKTVAGTSISGKIVIDTVMAEDSTGLALLANNKNGIHIDSVGINISGYLRSYANNTDSGYIQMGTASSGEMMPIISGKSESENVGLYFHTEPKDTLQNGYGLGAFFFNARGNGDNGPTLLDSGIVLNVSKNNSDTLFTIDANGNAEFIGGLTVNGLINGSMQSEDTRYYNYPSNVYSRSVKYEFKRDTTIDIPGTGYCGLMTFAPYASDGTGGLDYQIGFNEDGLYWRSGANNSDTPTWDAWSKIQFESGASDKRFKTNLKEIDNVLPQIMNLKAYKYDWKKDDYPNRKFEDGKQIGLIAQQVEEEFPELVKTDVDGYKSVKYDKITALLIQALKEQQKTLEAQSKEIEEIKKQLNK